MLHAETTHETLERLGQLDAGGNPVVSMYIDLAREHFALPDQRRGQLLALFGRARRQAESAGLRVDADISAMRQVVEGDGSLLRGARALALFSSAGAGLLEVVRLPRSVRPQVTVNSVPWLEPLAEALVDEHVAVAVVSRTSARIFRGSSEGLTAAGELHDEVHGRHAQGGRSQSRFQRGIEQEVAWHLARVAATLAAEHHARPFSDLVLVVSAPLRPLLEDALDDTVRRRLAGAVDADAEDADAEDVRRLVAPVLDDVAARREREVLDVFAQRLGTGGAAAAGLDDVLSALNDDRVATLLVAPGLQLFGGSCPTCGRLFADGDRDCPLDGAALHPVDAGEHAVERAARQSAEILVVRHLPDALSPHGSIGALLRW